MSDLEESPRRPRLARLLMAMSLVVSLSDAAHAADRPSRPPVKGCAWRKTTNAAIGLQAWVQRCDFGFRKVDFLFQGASLAARYSDGGGAPDPLVDVLLLKSGESHAAGIRRLFAERTAKDIAARCMMAPYRDGKPPAGVERYTFEPNGIQYFEAHAASAARKVLFVRVGQDEPLFDEQTLRLLPTR